MQVDCVEREAAPLLPSRVDTFSPRRLVLRPRLRVVFPLEVRRKLKESGERFVLVRIHRAARLQAKQALIFHFYFF